jgi:hypothetical protein
MSGHSLYACGGAGQTIWVYFFNPYIYIYIYTHPIRTFVGCFNHSVRIICLWNHFVVNYVVDYVEIFVLLMINNVNFLCRESSYTTSGLIKMCCLILYCLLPFWKLTLAYVQWRAKSNTSWWAWKNYILFHFSCLKKIKQFSFFILLAVRHVSKLRVS